jgi:hypothetical protein
MLCWLDLEIGHQHYCRMQWMFVLHVRQGPNVCLHG